MSFNSVPADGNPAWFCPLPVLPCVMKPKPELSRNVF